MTIFNNEASFINEQATEEIIALKEAMKWMDLIQTETGEMYLTDGEMVVVLTPHQRNFISKRGV